MGDSVIIKNSLVLYLRMIAVMLIGLYTSRVVLSVLGFDDYGIYQVVGSVVSVFSIFSASLTQAINRFLIFELGKSENNNFSVVFSTSVIIMSIIAIIVIVVGGCVGNWMINSILNIKPSRISAAIFVLYCSLISFAIGIISVPYDASIMAHERMGAFAIFSIFEAINKLLIVILISFSSFDKLKNYALLLMVLTVIIRLLKGKYCYSTFKECRFSLSLDKRILKYILSFSGWEFYGSSVWLLNHQGASVLLNVFFTTILNAARGIANQIESVISLFSQNVLTAIRPRVIKYYAAGRLNDANKIIIWGTKAGYFLMLYFSIPLFFECKEILRLWLGDVPDYAVVFTRAAIINTQSQMLVCLVTTAVFATGKIRYYVAGIGSIALLTLPITYFLLYIGYPPVSIYVVYFAIYTIMIPLRINYLDRNFGLPQRSYYNDIMLRCIPVSFIACIIPLILLNFLDEGLLRILLVFAVNSIMLSLIIFGLGLKKVERVFLLDFFKVHIRK